MTDHYYAAQRAQNKMTGRPTVLTVRTYVLEKYLLLDQENGEIWAWNATVGRWHLAYSGRPCPATEKGTTPS